MSEPDQPRARPRPTSPLRRFAPRLGAAAGFSIWMAAVATFYVFIISAGHFTSWRTWTAYYDPQAEGFRAGHLYTTVPVPPALKALKDPLNPANMHAWRWDYSYYDGHIYIYWGLLPPAILALVKTLFRVQRTISDDPLVFAFLCVQALAGALLVRAMARRLTPPAPRWSVWLAMTAFALAHPTPYLLARGAVYEGAIVAGSCFLVLALYFAFEGIFAPRDRDGAGAGAGLRGLMLASLCAGLSGASRVNLLPAAAAVMTLATLARWRGDGGGWRRLARLAPIVAAPVTLVTFAHLLVNHLRFGQWTEFGQQYQMGFRWFPFSLRYFLPDTFAYLFRAPTRWCHFPFISAEWGYPKDLFPRWLPVPEDYRVNEPTAGLFALVPWLWFLLAVPLALGLGRLARRQNGAPAPAAIAADPRWRWFLAVLAAAALTTLAVPLLVGAATMRYQGDFAPVLFLMACVGAWSWLASFRRRSTRALAMTVFLLLAAATIIAGALMGFTGYFTHFQRHNPDLMKNLHRLYVCKGP